MTMQDGDNRTTIDYGAEEAARLRQDYPWIEPEIEALKAEATTLQPIVDDESMGPWAKLEKRALDLRKRIELIHSAEKEPHLRRGQACDRLLFGAMESLKKPKPTGANGLADTIGQGIQKYMDEKLRKERAEREAREAAARETERKAQAARDEAARLVREAEAKAARARSDETRAAADEAARVARVAQDDKARELSRAAANRQQATDAASAKPADMVGTRVGNDIKVTMQKVYYARVENYDALAESMAVLWAFVPEPAKEQAVKAWAKTTAYAKQLPGTAIGYTEEAKRR